jgi:tetratricopeptide (TPR) repeat protein
MVRIVTICALVLTGLWGADEEHLALVSKADADFHRVELSNTPALRDVEACVLSEVSILPVASPDELPVAHYRKGYCRLASASITGNAGEFREAAAELDKAIETWPAPLPPGASSRKRPPEPIPAALPVLASIAALRAGIQDAPIDKIRTRISTAIASPNCSSTLMSTALCQASLDLGRRWLGWLALRRDDLIEAEQDFAYAPSGWPQWVAGRRAYANGKYQEAATQYRNAVEIARRESPSTLVERLNPRPDLPAELIELGGAQILAGDTTSAITTLDQAVKVQPENARPLFLRARAKELAGRGDDALADYNLAARTAFAVAQNLASGEAHLYRGIMYYRRKDFSHAEDEFASSLNFEIPASFRADAVAWRHLAAVSGGACEASGPYLQQSLAAASPFFPKAEAHQLLANCSTTAAR